MPCREHSETQGWPVISQGPKGSNLLPRWTKKKMKRAFKVQHASFMISDQTTRGMSWYTHAIGATLSSITSVWRLSEARMVLHDCRSDSAST